MDTGTAGDLAGSGAGGPSSHGAAPELGDWNLHRSDDAGASSGFVRTLDAFWGATTSRSPSPTTRSRLIYGASRPVSTDRGATATRINTWGLLRRSRQPPARGHPRHQRARRGEQRFEMDAVYFNTDGGTYVSYNGGATVQNPVPGGLGVGQLDPHLVPRSAPHQRRDAGPGIPARHARDLHRRRPLDGLRAGHQWRLRPPHERRRHPRVRLQHLPGLHPRPARRDLPDPPLRGLPGGVHAAVAAARRRRPHGPPALLLPGPTAPPLRTGRWRELGADPVVERRLRGGWGLYLTAMGFAPSDPNRAYALTTQGVLRVERRRGDVVVQRERRAGLPTSTARRCSSTQDPDHVLRGRGLFDGSGA